MSSQLQLLVIEKKKPTTAKRKNKNQLIYGISIYRMRQKCFRTPITQKIIPGILLIEKSMTGDHDVEPDSNFIKKKILSFEQYGSLDIKD